MASSTAPALPLLAYVYHPLSFAPLSITEAAAGVCDVLWLVDCSNPDAAATSRLLRRFGPVVDFSGRTLEETAAALRGQRPDGLVSLHDSDLVWTAKLAALMSLPFHSLETALKLTDKHLQRQALRGAGLAVPDFRIIAAEADGPAIDEAQAGFTYPGVLKPRCGQASRNTLPIPSRSELQATIEQLCEEDGAQIEDYVLEGFVPDAKAELAGRGFANFVSVESVVEDGHVAHASISARTPFRWPFRETGYFTPSALADELVDEVLTVAAAAAHALGVTVGCLHTEIKLTDDGPVVIEVNGRPGGGMSEMLERASGVSILQIALRLAVGEHVGLQGLVPCGRVAYLLYVFPEEELDTIDTVEGLQDLRQLEGVDELVLVRGPGQRIDWREGSEAHVFHFAGTVRDHAELRKLIAAIPRVVHIAGHTASRPG